jgi:raffinose/stachyose/melibiose transport system permease protein
VEIKEVLNSSIRVDNKIHKIANYIILILIMIAVLLPMLILLIMSFKTDQEYMNSGLLQLPRNLNNLKNYKIVMDGGKFLLGFKNTLILCIVPIVGSITMGTMVAYVFGRFHFPLKKVLLMAFVVVSLIPNVLTQIATFTIIKNLGLFNSIFAGIVLYIATNVLQIYIFLQFIDKIPMELDESALIDGASYFRIYRSIILPQMRPAIATAAILGIVGIYNDMLTPYLYMPKSSLRTVTTSLMKFSYDKNSQWNVMAAAIITVMIPTIIAYIFLQRFIFSGITDGAVKS